MNHKDKLHGEVETMTRLFNLGAHVAIEMLEDGQLPFDEWYGAVTKKGDISTTPTNNLRLIWIWDSLRQDADLKDFLKDLSPAGMQWNRHSGPFLVLQRDSWLLIGLQHTPASTLLSSRSGPPEDEKVSIQLLDDLLMRPGRNDHLECSDCKCLLQLRVDVVYSTEREMDILGVKYEQIVSLREGVIQVLAPSINHAYTIASRRLEPERRSHSGNIYEHVVYVGDRGRFLLGDIRLAVEIGEWGSQVRPDLNSSDDLLFPK